MGSARWRSSAQDRQGQADDLALAGAVHRTATDRIPCRRSQQNHLAAGGVHRSSHTKPAPTLRMNACCELQQGYKTAALLAIKFALICHLTLQVC